MQQKPEQRKSDVERRIAKCEETLARDDTPKEHQAFLRREIAKMKRSLAKKQA